MNSKDSIRRSLKKTLAALGREQFHAEGLAAAAALEKQPVYSEAQTLLLFMSRPDEIDTEPLLKQALARHKRVFLPRITGDHMWFYRVLGPDFPRRPGAFGIREALGGEVLAGGDFPALIVVPGLGFDFRGNRLGRGRAYYDRFFARISQAGAFAAPAQFFALGYCAAVQLVPEVPADPWDRPMNGICTGGGFLLLKEP